MTTKDGKTDKVVVGGDSGGCGGGQNISERMRSLNVVGEELLVDGWPKWLTDNIPRDVLAGIVARSADSYDKLYKVSHFLRRATEIHSSYNYQPQVNFVGCG